MLTQVFFQALVMAKNSQTLKAGNFEVHMQDKPTVPHLKDLIHICLEPEDQRHILTLKVL